jgi:hypothetical protein
MGGFSNTQKSNKIIKVICSKNFSINSSNKTIIRLENRVNLKSQF